MHRSGKFNQSSEDKRDYIFIQSSLTFYSHFPLWYARAICTSLLWDFKVFLRNPYVITPKIWEQFSLVIICFPVVKLNSD